MNTKRRIRCWIPPALLAPAVLLLGSCATTRDWVTDRPTFNRYSLDQEIALGKEAYEHNLNELEEDEIETDADPERVGQIRNMMLRIAAVSDKPDLPYEAVLVHNGVVNACCFPGGRIMVFDGLLDVDEGGVADEDELAAVVAHEIAHATCRHATERLSRIDTAETIMNVAYIATTLAGKGDLADQLDEVFTETSDLLIPVYRQSCELEADRVGMRYMAMAGYDPRAAPRMWKRGAIQSAHVWSPADIYSTHPTDATRFAQLEALVPQALEVYEDVEHADFSGSWDTRFGKMQLSQADGEVTGRYASNDGRLKGTVCGRVCIGRWSEAPTYEERDGAGDAVFYLGEDGRSFTGRWRFGSDGDWDGDWEGGRIEAGSAR